METADKANKFGAELIVVCGDKTHLGQLNKRKLVCIHARDSVLTGYLCNNLVSN